MTFSESSYRVVFEEDIAPFILDVEEETEHEEDVDGGNEEDDHEATVEPPPHPRVNI